MNAPSTSPKPSASLPPGAGVEVLPPCDGLDARQFQLAVKRLADSLNFGADRSPFLGSGQEYVQSRPYQPGDPVKAIDWRVTARTGKAHIKEYEALRRMPAWLLVDTSASMTVSSMPLSKYAWAVQLAGGLAFACLDRASPVGLMTAGGRELRVEPSLSRATVMRWLHELRYYHTTEPTLLGAKLARLLPALSGRSLLIVLSDLHDPAAAAVLKTAAQRHEVIVVQLQDSAEESAAGAGFFRGREAETGREYLSRRRNDSLDFDATAKILRQAGIDHLRLRTDRPILAPLRNFVKSRGVFGRLAR